MILVTGGTGLVGGHLLYQLIKSGETLKAIKRHSSDIQKTKKIFSYYADNYEELFSKIEWVDGDVLQVLVDLDSTPNTFQVKKNNGGTPLVAYEFTWSGIDFGPYGGILYPMLYTNNAAIKMVANFGQDSSFAGEKTAQARHHQVRPGCRLLRRRHRQGRRCAVVQGPRRT